MALAAKVATEKVRVTELEHLEKYEMVAKNREIAHLRSVNMLDLLQFNITLVPEYPDMFEECNNLKD